MKIALIHPAFARTGGTERYGLDLARCLHRLGDEIHLIGRTVRNSPPGTACHEIMLPILGGSTRIEAFDRAVTRVLRREIRASLRPFDLVVSLGRTFVQDVVRLGGGCHAAYLEAVGAADLRDPHTIQRLSRRDRVRLAWERHMASPGGTRHIIAVSHRVKAEMTAHYAIDETRMSVIHNGVDTARFRPARDSAERRGARIALGLPPDGDVVLFAGNGLHRKGFDVLVEAFRIAARVARARGVNRRLVLLCAGKDARRRRPPLRSLRRSLARLGAEIHTPGTIDPIETAYHAADLLVLPSRYEPFGNVCLEAMAAGLPVVTTRRNGVAEILDRELSRFLLPTASATDDLVKHLLALLDPSLRRRLGRRARAVALSHTLERHAAQVREVLLTVVRDPAWPGSPARSR